MRQWECPSDSLMTVPVASGRLGEPERGTEWQTTAGCFGVGRPSTGVRGGCWGGEGPDDRSRGGEAMVSRLCRTPRPAGARRERSARRPAGRGLLGEGAAQDHPRGRAGLHGGAGRESFPCHYPVVTFGPCHLTCLSLNFLFCRMDIMSLQQ